MSESKKKIWLFAVWGFAIAMTIVLFPLVFFSNGHIVPSFGGDAGKNIFSLVYHSLYDKGWLFTGMNYPYGDHISYSDGQPLLSVSAGYLGCTHPGQVLSAMWALIILSYMLAVVFTYKVLCHFGVRPVLALLFSGLIITLSPQLFRTYAHFGLSYACLVPMLFFWTIQYDISARWKYVLYMFLLGLAVNFLHPYLTALVMVWGGLYSIGYLLFAKTSVLKKLRRLLPLLSGVVLLLVTVMLFIKVTDNVADRPATPYGMTVYCTEGIHIFTSGHSPIWQAVHDGGRIARSSGQEGFAYPGLVVLIVIALSFVSGVIYRFRKSSVASGQGNAFPGIWVFVGMAALVLAMGVPFVWGMEWVTDYVPFLKNFRTLGRFAWIFYYVMTVYAVVTLYRFYTGKIKSGNSLMANVVLAGALLLWGYEASGYISDMHGQMQNGEDNYEELIGRKGDTWNRFLEENGHSSNDFQGILLLPFFHLGTDKLWVGNNTCQYGVGVGTIAGIQLHLSWVNSMMARASWSAAQRQVKIAAGPFAEKPVLKDLHDDRAFLLLHYSGLPLDDNQKYLLQFSERIGTFRNCDVYACYPKRIVAGDSEDKERVLRIAASMGNRKADSCVGCGGAGWFVNHFDTGTADRKFFGEGATNQIAAFETVVADISVAPASESREYEFSCWFLLGDNNYRSPFFKLDMVDASNSIIASTGVFTKESTDSRGLWFRAGGFVNIPPDCTHVVCRLRNEPDNTYKVIDELMLRPVGATIISRGKNSEVMANNHLISSVP